MSIDERGLSVKRMYPYLGRGFLPLILIFGILASRGLASNGSDGDLQALLEEEGTVEAASRHPQNLADAPAHVTIITKQEIEEFGYQTISEAISAVAGFFVRDDRSYTYLGVRGFAPFGDYGSHVLVMVDGHPMIEPIFSSSFFERNQPVDLRYVQRIEVVLGPGSSLYGTNAVLAVVNIITTKATESDPVALGASVLSDQGADAFASLSRVGTSGFQAKISGAASWIRGFDYYFKKFDYPATNYGKADGLDRERTWSVHTQIDKYGWSLSGLVSRRAKITPTASWGSIFGDDRLETNDMVGFIDSKYEARLGAVSHLSGRLTFDWYSYKGVWPMQSDDVITVMEDPNTSKVAGGELVVSSQALKRNHLLAGLSLKRVLGAHLGSYQTEPEYYENVDLEETDQIFSAFAQDELSLYAGRLTGILGIRYDHYRSFGNTLAPRFGLILKTRAGATKLLYGKSFRAPTFYERYYDDAGVDCEEGAVRGNPGLRAEDAYTYEIVHDADLGNMVHATVSAFYYRISGLVDEIELDGGCLTSVNSGLFHSGGLEAELHGALPRGLRWWVSCAFIDAKNRETGKRLPVSPDKLATVRLSMPFLMPRTSLGLSMRYIGTRLTKTGDELGSSLVTDVTLYMRKLAQGVSLSVSAKNVFDAVHLESAGPEHVQDALPQDRRVIAIRASWEL